VSNESFKDEEQAKVLKERPSRSILCIQSFLFGSFISFALEGIAFAGCTLVHMFGKNIQKQPASGWPEEAVIFVILYLLILYEVITKYPRWLCMRKKFDEEDPSSGSSIWTERILMIVEVYFVNGAFVGSVSLWNIVFFLSTGIVLPWPPAPITMIMIAWVLFLIAVEWFDWMRSHNWDQTTEHELEDDSGFLV
jgi:hypothetical protein